MNEKMRRRESKKERERWVSGRNVSALSLPLVSASMFILALSKLCILWSMHPRFFTSPPPQQPPYLNHSHHDRHSNGPPSRSCPLAPPAYPSPQRKTPRPSSDSAASTLTISVAKPNAGKMASSATTPSTNASWSSMSRAISLAIYIGARRRWSRMATSWNWIKVS